MGHLFVNSSHKPTGFDATVWAVKVVLITVGTVSSLILVKISVIPCLSSFLISTLPCLWSFLRSFFSPPYIYILLNFIILIIVASSTFEQQSHHLKKPQTLKILYQITDYDRLESHDQKPKIWYQITDYDRFESHDHEGVIAVLDEAEVEKHALEPLEKVVVGSHLDSSLSGKPSSISEEGLAEVKGMIAEPPEPRSPMKPEKPWEPEEPRKQEEPDNTFDSIWKSIMESKGKPLPGPDPEPEPELCPGLDDPAVCAQRETRKSNTFKEETAPLMLGKILSQDELNLRAEAFIKKINLDMRLEREESDRRFMDMVNRSR